MVNFWTYTHPSYKNVVLQLLDGLLAAAPGPLAAALGPEIVLT